MGRRGEGVQEDAAAGQVCSVSATTAPSTRRATCSAGSGSRTCGSTPSPDGRPRYVPVARRRQAPFCCSRSTSRARAVSTRHRSTARSRRRLRATEGRWSRRHSSPPRSRSSVLRRRSVPALIREVVAAAEQVVGDPLPRLGAGERVEQDAERDPRQQQAVFRPWCASFPWTRSAALRRSAIVDRSSS